MEDNKKALQPIFNSIANVLVWIVLTSKSNISALEELARERADSEEHSLTFITTLRLLGTAIVSFEVGNTKTLLLLLVDPNAPIKSEDSEFYPVKPQRRTFIGSQ